MPNGSLEVMPGPRVGLSISPDVVPTAGSVTFEVCGVAPNGPFAMFVVDWNGAPVGAHLFGAFADAEGEFVLPVALNPTISNVVANFNVVAFDALPQIVWSLPAMLTVL